MHINVNKILVDNGIAYREIRHDSFNFPINSPADFARALGYDISRITKSVFLSSKSKEKYLMAVCSIDKKLNLSRLSLLANTNKIEVVDKQELANIIGYPPNGVCAIGIPYNIEIFIDESLSTFSSILIGSGEAHVEIEITPIDLVKCSKAHWSNIVL